MFRALRKIGTKLLAIWSVWFAMFVHSQLLLPTVAEIIDPMKRVDGSAMVFLIALPILALVMAIIDAVDGGEEGWNETPPDHP